MLPVLTLHPLLPNNHRQGVVVALEAVEIEELAVLLAVVLLERNGSGNKEDRMAATMAASMVSTMMMRQPAMMLKMLLTTCMCPTMMLPSPAMFLCGRKSMFVLCLMLTCELARARYRRFPPLPKVPQHRATFLKAATLLLTF
jgi:hypothetical protein